METDERRRHKRFKAWEGIVVSTPMLLGTLVDISQGGLAFKYLDFRKPSAHSPQRLNLIHQGDYLLRDIPFRAVNDTPVHEDQCFYGKVSLRRCGGEFGELNAEQRQALKMVLTELAGSGM